MPALPPRFSRLVVITIIMAVVVEGLAIYLVFAGDAMGAIGLLAALAALAAALGMAWICHVDLRAAAGYAARLAEGGAAPSPQVHSPAASILTASIASLHQTLVLRAEEAATQREVNDAVIDALHDPLLMIDRRREIVRVNHAARNLFGDRLEGRDLAASLRHPGVLEAVEAVLSGTASRSVEFTLSGPVERVFEARVKPFRPSAPDGAVASRLAGTIILTLHDITAIRRSDQMRADFIANASHELRTPLSTLLGFIETLRGPAREDAEAHDRFLAIMHDQASRMSRLVSDLLSLSRIEQDEHMPPAGLVDIGRTLKGVVAALELKAATRRIRMTIMAPPALPAVIGDEDQLAQVFQNLVTNAIKYTREQTDVTITVTLSDGAAVGLTASPALAGAGGRRRAGSPMVAIAVADHGEGIARTHLPRLTERFYRVDAARSRALGGTGLGLAIVKHIVNRHRGRLTIESEVGAGSTFTVYLPTAAEVEAGNALHARGSAA